MLLHTLHRFSFIRMMHLEKLGIWLESGKLASFTQEALSR